MTETRTLSLPDVDLVYDVRGPLPHDPRHRPLVMIGQPMCADGFADLAAELADRTVITYDPRGLGRSTTRRDGRNDQRPEDQADDLHALLAHLGTGPVDVFGSSGGAVAGLTWVATYAGDVSTLVAHSRRRPGRSRTTPTRSTGRWATSAAPTRSGASGPGWRSSSR